jgi:hypothetical protein
VFLPNICESENSSALSAMMKTRAAALSPKIDRRPAFFIEAKNFGMQMHASNCML